MAVQAKKDGNGRWVIKAKMSGGGRELWEVVGVVNTSSVYSPTGKPTSKEIEMIRQQVKQILNGYSGEINFEPA
jgi:hypothetical protein